MGTILPRALILSRRVGHRTAVRSHADPVRKYGSVIAYQTYASTSCLIADERAHLTMPSYGVISTI